MMSGAGRPAEAELRELEARLAEIQKNKAALATALDEQTESYVRVTERAAQARSELRERERQLAELDGRIAAHQRREKSLFLTDERGAEAYDDLASDEKEDGDAFTDDVLQNWDAKPRRGGKRDALRLEDAINALREQLDDIGERLGVERSQSRTPTAAVLSVDAVQRVTIDFRGEVCGFRITADYTFEQLAQDACRFWRVDPAGASLRDATSSLWPTSSIVREVLREELARQAQSGSANISMPRIRLVTTNDTAPTGRDGQGRDGEYIRQRSPSAIEPSSEISHREAEREYLAQLILSRDRQERDSKRRSSYKRRAEKAQIAIAKTLSEVFHDPHEQPYGLREANFSSGAALAEKQHNATGASESRAGLESLRLQTRLTRACFMLFLWTGFITITCTALLFRYDTGSVYSNTASFESRLTESFPAVEPLLFEENTERYIFTTDENVVTNSRIARKVFPFAQINDVYSFLRSILLPILFESNSSAVENRLASGQQALLGPLIIRQNRVRAGSCNLSSKFRTVASACYSGYTTKSKATEPFGPELNSTGATEVEEAKRMAFEYEDVEHSLDRLTVGYYSSYDASGFFANISEDQTLEQAQEFVDYLELNGWLDRSTRALVISFVLKNSNVNMIIGSDIRLELSPSGAVHSSLLLNRADLDLYDNFGVGSTLRNFLITADVVTVTYACFLMYLVLVDMIVFGVLRTITTIWNLLTIALFLASVVGLGVKIAYSFKGLKTNIDDFSTYDSLRSAFATYELALWLDVFTAACGVLLVFRFTQANRQISAIFETIYRASRVASALIFVILLLVFATLFASFLVYGPKMDGWRSFQNTILNNMRFLMGGFDYASFRTADVFFTFFFYSFLVVYFFFISVAMMTAVFIDAYYEVAAVGLPRAKPHRFWSKVLLSPFVLFFGRRDDMTDALRDPRGGGISRATTTPAVR